MTQDEIMEAAYFAGAAKFYPEAQSVKEQNYIVTQGFLERFAKVVAAKEREACAKVCEGKSDRWASVSEETCCAMWACGVAIRARSTP